MFTRRRAAGFWTFDSVVTGDEFEYFDDSISKAIDGSGGGTYALSAGLTIGGVPTAFVRINSDFTANGQFITLGLTSASELYINAYTVSYAPGTTFENNVTVGTDESKSLTIRAFSTFYGTTTYQGAAFFYQTAQFEAATTFKAPASFQGNVTLGDSSADSLTVNATSNFTGSLSCSGPTTLDGSTTLQGPLTMGSGGSIVHNVAAGDDSITTFSPIDFHEVVMEPGVLTGSTDWHIDDAGCQDGNEILFGNKDSTNSITVRRPGGVPVPKPNGSSLNLLGAWCRCVRINGAWTLAQYGVYP